jgi:glycosyltransferase involved in cell wall biosynthesis
MHNDTHDLKLKICFIAHYAYGTVSGSPGGHVGGIERQIDLMSKWLVKQGHDITVITWQEGPDTDEVINGVKIIKLCKMTEGIRGLRYLHPRLTSMISAMKKADADIYYQNGSEDITGHVAIWCKLKGKRFVFSSASDVDCTKELPELKHVHERVLYKIGIKLASVNITQTERQHKTFSDSFRLDSITLPMPCEGPAKSECDERAFPQEKHILWIGRLNKDKRLEMLLEIAEKLKNINFHVAGKPNDTEYPKIMMSQMKAIDNLTYHGALAKDSLRELYKKGFLLCNTSLYEGFPNTYLEAWSYGIPVFTTVDPDDVITKQGLGCKLNDSASFVEKIDELSKDEKKWETMSKRAREYYLKNHELDSVMKRFEKVFYDTMALD